MKQAANSESSGPGPRRAKMWPMALGGVLLAPVLLVLLAPAITQIIVRPKVVAALRESLNGEPRIARLSFSVFSGLEIQGLSIANPPGFPAGPCVTVERVTADPSLAALLGGSVVLNGVLHVERPRVFVEQDAQGRINLACLAKPPEPAIVAETKPEETPAAALPSIIAGLLVEDLVISVKTPATPQPAALASIRMEANVDTLEKPVTFGVKSADESLVLKGHALVARDGKLDIANLQGELDYALKPEMLAPVVPVVGSIAGLKKLDGKLAGEGHLALDGLAKPSGKGHLTLDVREAALELGASGTNVVYHYKPGEIRFAYDFKSLGDRHSDVDLQLTLPAASAAVKGRVTADMLAPAMEGEVNVAADIAALAERYPGLIATDRKLQGRIAGGVKSLKATTKSVEGNLDLRGEGLAEIGQTGALVPLVKDLAIRLRLNADLEKNIYHVENLDAHLDDVLDVKGRARFEQRTAGSAIETDVRAETDLAVLLGKARCFTALIPPALQLAGRVKFRLVVPPEQAGQPGTPFDVQATVAGLNAFGVAVPAGSVKLGGSGSPGWTKVGLKQFDLTADIAPAPVAGGAMAQPVKVTVAGRGDADTAAGRYEVPELRVTLPDADVTADARVELPPKAGQAPLNTGAIKIAAKAKAAGKIKPMLDLARVWGVKLEGMDASGALATQAEVAGTLAQLAVRVSQTEVKEFALSGPKAPVGIQWPQSLACDAQLSFNAVDLMKSPVEIASGTLRGCGLDVTTVKGKVALDVKSEQTDLQIAGKVNPTALAAVVPGYLKDLAVASGPGPFDVRLRGALQGARSEISAKLELPDTTLKAAKFSSEPIALGKPSLDLQASLDQSNNACRLSRASLKTALAEMEAQGNVAMDAQGQLTALDGQMQASASLLALRPVAVAMGVLSNDVELAGNLKLAADVKASGNSFPYSATLSAAQLHFKGPQTKGVPIDEPAPVLKLAGTVVNAKEGFSLAVAEGSELQAQIARGTMSGMIRKNLNKPPVAENLMAKLTYDPARLKPLLSVFNAGEIQSAEPQNVQFTFTGPLVAGDNLLAWLSAFVFKGELGYGAYTHSGVKVEGPPIGADMRDGLLRLDYACKVNGGPTTLKGLVDVKQNTRLSFSTKEINLSAVMPDMLGFLGPFLHTQNGSVEGQAFFGLDDFVYDAPLPVGTATVSAAAAPPDMVALLTQHLRAKGSFAVKNLKVTGSPLLAMLLKFLGDGQQQGAVGEIQQTNFTIDRGVFRYEKMVLSMGGVEFTFSGTVKFDQTMDMQIVLPMPKKLLSAGGSSAATITLPLTGKVSNPQLDLAKAVQSTVKDAVGSAIKNKAGDMFQGILGGKK